MSKIAQIRVRALKLHRAPQQLKDSADDVMAAALEACDALLRDLSGAQLDSERLSAQLRGEVAAWEQLFELMPCPCVLTDPQGRIVDANEAAGDLLNVAASRLKGRQLLLFSEDRSAFGQVLARIAEGHPFRTSLTLRPREQKPAPTNVTLAPLMAQHSGMWIWFVVPCEAGVRRKTAVRTSTHHAGQDADSSAVQGAVSRSRITHSATRSDSPIQPSAGSGPGAERDVGS